MPKVLKTSVFILIFFQNISAGQGIFSSEQKLVSLVKVWGLLKYHHPAVTSGKMDWDSVFIQKFYPLRAAILKITAGRKHTFGGHQCWSRFVRDQRLLT